jgi:hypothetical protein
MRWRRLRPAERSVVRWRHDENRPVLATDDTVRHGTPQQPRHGRAEALAARSHDDHQGVVLRGDGGQERDGVPVGGVVGPARRSTRHGRIDLSVLLGQDSCALLLPVGDLGADVADRPQNPGSGEAGRVAVAHLDRLAGARRRA